MAGKLKAAKEQTKKTDKGRRSKDDSAKVKSVKDKEKKRNSKRKKTPETKRVDSSASVGIHRDDSDPLFEDHADVFRLKGKKKVSKECEEAVTNAVSDFFESAWLACAERFFITSAPVNVSYELRNTWLRIMEAEYQDTGLRGKILSAKINRVFKSDEPPLPLAFDTWSRGAIELLPRVKRESVLDPFLREFDSFGQMLSDKTGESSGSAATLATMDSKSENEKETIPSEKALPIPADKNKVIGEKDRVSSPPGDAPPGETWNFALDEKDSIYFPPDTTTTATSDTRTSLGSNLSDGGLIQDKLLHFLFSTEPYTKDDSITEIDSAVSSSRVRSVKSTSTSVEHFSPSQCGGHNGSGIFRLHGVTTSEALVRSVNMTPSEDSMKEYARERSDLVEKHAGEHEDIVHVSRKIGDDDHDSDEEIQVHPLFDEVDHTPRSRFTNKSIHRLQEQTAWRGDPYSDSRLDEVVSDTTREFTTRRLLDLHGRFRRQAMRSMAARIKAAIVSRKDREESLVVGDSRSSITSGSGKGRRKSDRKSILNNTSSNHSIKKSLRGASQVYFLNRPLAKGTVSAPQLFTHKKEPVQRQQKFQLRNVESKRAQRSSFARDKSQSLQNIKRDKTSISRGQSPHNTKKVTTTANRNSQPKDKSPHNTRRDVTPTSRNLQRDKSQPPNTTKKNNPPLNRNFPRDKSQSPHNTRRDNMPSNRSATLNKSKSPRNSKKDYVASNRNIPARDSARSSRSLTSKLPSRKFSAMGNVRSTNKADLISKAGKSEISMRQAQAPNNQFQFGSENRRKFEPGSIELQGKPWKKVPQEEPCDCASTTSDCSIKPSLERVR